VNIAYLSTFYPFRGGIAQFNASLYRAFEHLGHNPHAFTFSRQYPDILFPGETQFVTEYDIADPIPSTRILDSINPLSWYSTAKEINKIHPDILLTKFWMPFIAPSLGTVAGRVQKKTKKICIVDNALPHERRPGDIALTSYFLDRNDGFIVMSDTVEKDLLSLKPQAKICRHNHPLYNHFGSRISREEACKTLHIPSDKHILLFFGFIRSYKGLSLLLDAMKLLPDNYHLVIAGEMYGSFDAYQQQIETLHLQDKISLHIRYISDVETPLFFSAADVCILPYISATQSGIIAIAHHFETPVIATNVGSLSEALYNGSAGMLIDKPEPHMIADSVHTFFSTKLSDQYIAAVQSIKNELSWESLGKAIIEFSEKL
jgi:glycosyltransferase involved in cell wall biosynthesis